VLKRTLFLFISIWFLPHWVLGQQDSANVKNYPTSYFTEYSLDRNLDLIPEDTTMLRNEIYHPYYRQYGMFQDLGNIGTPGRSLFFTFDRKTDFYLGSNPYQVYFKTPETTKYYHTKKPYADFKYTQGQRDLLLFAGKFAINLSPRFNFGVDYDRVTSEGFYPRQYTSGYFTNMFTSYQSENKRYGVIGNMIWNRGILDESGGLTNDSIFETLRGVNKAAPVKLESSQSRFKNKTFFAKQYYYLGKMNQLIENEDTSYSLSRAGFISHTLRYDDNNFYFDNPNGEFDSTLFPKGNIDTTGVFYDSIGSNTWMNRLAYAYWTKSNERQQSFIEFAVAHKHIRTQQMLLTNSYNNVWGEAKMERIPKTSNNLGIKLGGTYCLSGYNASDFKFEAEIKYLNDWVDITAGLSNQLTEPDYVFTYYQSAPLSWTNRFSKMSITHWKADIQTKKYRHNFSLKFNQYIIANWVYFGKDILPEQTNKILLINTIEASKTFQLGWFRFENILYLQKANQDIIRLPELGANLRYYVNGHIFKKALYLQMGAELFYNSSYYGNAYAPSARAFYIQDQNRIGNYPMVDVFLTGQVMTAVIYVKYEHVNMDWQNVGYYYTPHYPLPVRAFRLGLRLRLYN
jgi:hypothetical protein